jgi:predicted AlkP superfamily pyrophosphatase or phosphodiesterase
VQDIISQLDNLTAYLFDQLKQKNLLDSINIILTADHGHVNVDIKNVMFLEDIIGDDIILGQDVIISQNSLFPQNSKFQSIFVRA